MRHVRNGTWGDHIAIQGIPNMLSVKINVLSSDCPMMSLRPGSCFSKCELFVGLIMLYHNVGLDKIPDSSAEKNVHNVPNTGSENSIITEAKSDSHDSAVAQNTLDDVTIEKEDQYRWKITGVP